MANKNNPERFDKMNITLYKVMLTSVSILDGWTKEEFDDSFLSWSFYIDNLLK